MDKQMQPKTENLSSSLDNIDVNDIDVNDILLNPQGSFGWLFNEGVDPSSFDAEENSSNRTDLQLPFSGLPSSSNDPFLNVPTTSASLYTSIQTMPNDISSNSNNGNHSAVAPTNNMSWSGPYGFHVFFFPSEQTTKTAAWTYSEIAEKLYVLLGSNCPIGFQTSQALPPGCTIKVTSVYVKPAHSLDVVRRCLNHMNPSDPCNMDTNAPADHVIRCDSHVGTYTTDAATEQRRLVLNYVVPESNSATYLFKFMCWSSCVGGMNRRRIQVMFSLEDRGRCIGRRTVEVRICACPGRDRRMEEKRIAEKMRDSESKNKAPIIEDTKRRLTTISESLQPTPQPIKKVKLNTIEPEYVIKVKDYQHFKILKSVKKALQNMKSGKKDSSDDE